MSADVVIAGIDVQASGLQVRICASLQLPAAEPLSSEALTASDGFESAGDFQAQALLTAVAATQPALVQAFEQIRTSLELASATLLAASVSTLVPAGGAQ